MSDINVTIAEKEIIAITLDSETINVTLEGGLGTTDHAALSNLDYDHAGHTGFQKKIDWDDDYNAFLVDKT